MKLPQVFGLVVSVHLAVLAVIFSTPGCRSNGRHQAAAVPPPPPASIPEPTAPIAPIDQLSGQTVAPMNYTSPAITPISYNDSPDSIRLTPTRPNNVESTTLPAAAPTTTYTVAKNDNLWLIAKKHGISVDELAAANQLAKTATLRLGQQLTVPAKASASTQSTSPGAANAYVVKSGDTLGSIARKHGTTVAALRTANNLSNDNLRVAQSLVIPGNATPLSNGATNAISAPVTSTSSAAPRAGTTTYGVVPGDTLGSIARRFGVKVGDLATLNRITDPAKLRVGQVLKLPANAQAPADSAATTVSATAPVPVSTAATATEPDLLTSITPILPVEPIEAPTPIVPINIPVISIEPITTK